MNIVKIVLYNRDSLTDGSIREAGQIMVRHSTGEAYFTKTDGTEVALRGQAYRDLISMLDKNKILPATTVIPDSSSLTDETLDFLDMRTEMYLDTTGSLPDAIQTYSVHKILIERDFTNKDEWGNEAVNTQVKLKRLSQRTLARDVEIEDKRIDAATGVSNGITNVDDLLNYMLNLPFDFDTHIDAPNSNKRLGTDKNDKLADKITIKLKKLDNPMDNLDDTYYANTLLTGLAGKQIKERIGTDITNLRVFKSIKVSNTNAVGTVTEQTINAIDNHDTFTIKTDQRTGFRTTSVIDGSGIVTIGHALITPLMDGVQTKTIDVTSAQLGNVINVLSKIVMDDNGHILEVNSKNIYGEINNLFYNKAESTAKFVNTDVTTEEYMIGSLGVEKDITVGGNLLITGDLNVNGTATSSDVSEVTITDPIVTFASGNTDNALTHVGMRFKRGIVGGVGIAGKDAFLVYDKSTDAFTVVYAKVTDAAPITLTEIELADISAQKFVGLADYATRLKSSVTLDLAGTEGDVQSGSFTILGNETTITKDIVLNRAREDKYGVVRILNDLSVVPENDEVVYSSKALHPLIYDLAYNFKKSDALNLNDANYYATAKAVKQLNDKLTTFTTLWLQSKQIEENNLRIANTVVINKTITASSSFSKAVGATTMEVNHDWWAWGNRSSAIGILPGASLAVSIPETVILARRNNLKHINANIAYKSSIDAASTGYFRVEVREYADATTSTYNVIMSQDVNFMDNVDTTGTALVNTAELNKDKYYAIIGYNLSGSVINQEGGYMTTGAADPWRGVNCYVLRDDSANWYAPTPYWKFCHYRTADIAKAHGKTHHGLSPGTGEIIEWGSKSNPQYRYEEYGYTTDYGLFSDGQFWSGTAQEKTIGSFYMQWDAIYSNNYGEAATMKYQGTWTHPFTIKAQYVNWYETILK